MKISKIHLENFKRFHRKTIEFPENDLVVLLGKNGSGKSTILQAIAAVIGTATGRLGHPTELDWPGFDWDLADSAWPTARQIEVTTTFTADEIAATRDFFARTPMVQEGKKIIPGNSPSVILRYNTTKAQQIAAPTHAQYFQFSGRQYASAIIKHAPEGYGLFERVGSVFWYPEQRTTNSLTMLNGDGQHFTFDLNALRRTLADRMNFHDRVRSGKWQLRSGQHDLYEELAQAYSKVFSTRSFHGSVPRSEPDAVFSEPWFYLYDGVKTYELSEMSGGERAIFPMLFDFVNWNIHNSIILIDEIELHLHPPIQQNLVYALRQLGKNNQFIITTHSQAVVDVIAPDSIIRL